MVQIVYATMTKHSQKVARALAEKYHTKAENVKEDPKTENVDTLILVGGLYGGNSNEALLEYAKHLNADQVKQVLVVTGTAAMKNGQEDLKQVLIEKNIQLLKEILFPGGFLLMKAGHPKPEDIEQVLREAEGVVPVSQ